MPLRRPILLLSLFAWGALLAACGGGAPSGSGTTSLPPPATYTVASGVAQKGPFVTGSTITMQELGLNLAATGAQYTAATDSDLGTFTPGATFASRYIGVTATGYYHDEVLGDESDAPVTLQSYADIGTDATLNVNLLTTLASTRIYTLVTSGGLAFADARTQAEGEVLAAFGIATSPAVAPFGTLDVADAGAGGTATDGDRILAALSAMIVQGRDASQVGTLVAALQADIGANGAITDPASQQAIAASSQALDVQIAAARLTQLYATVGSTFTADALAQWLARDGDGVIGHDEFRVDDAAPSASFTLPDDFAAAHDGASLSASAGQLWVNGTPAAAATVVHAGDVIAVSAPAALADGVTKIYLTSGPGTRVARVSFVKGLASIAISSASGSLPAGVTQAFAATGTFNDGHTEDITTSVTWSSGTPAVADIDTTIGVSDALAAGTTVVSAVSGNEVGTASLTVVSAAIQSISIAPTALVTGVGITRGLAATGTFTDGSVADVTASVTWASQAPATATVNQGQVTGVALGTTTVTATAGSATASVPVSVATDVWTPAAAMPTSRVAGASTTVLADGRLLVVGGAGTGGTTTAAADLYDPAGQQWDAAGAIAPMSVARSSHTATLLSDGRVLVVGGATPGSTSGQGYVNLASAEIYAPASNTWTPAASLNIARSHHTATLLADGRVLVTGGENLQYLPETSAEIYDPATDTWTLTSTPMASARSTQTATLLADGRVLVVGGYDIVQGAFTPLASAELYDPATDTFALAPAPSGAHAAQTATLLPDGTVMVVDGSTATAEAFDPASGHWDPATTLQSLRSNAVAVLLPGGRLLVAGGTESAPNAERYDATSATWAAAAAMPVNRDTPLAALLPDGSAIVCGGAAFDTSTRCDIYW